MKKREGLIDRAVRLYDKLNKVMNEYGDSGLAIEEREFEGGFYLYW